MLILGDAAVSRSDGNAVLAAVRDIVKRYNLVVEGDDTNVDEPAAAGWNGCNLLHTAASRVGGLDLGLVPGKGGLDVAGMVKAAGKGDLDVLYLLGADEIDVSALGDAFVIYQGHHGDVAAPRADVILPGAAYTEKNATYVNTEGRPQRAKLAVFPPGDAKEDWKILRALSEAVGKKLPLDTLSQVRARMEEIAPQLTDIDVIQADALAGRGQGREVLGLAVQVADRRFLPDRSDQPGLGNHGRVQCAAQPQRKGDRHPWLSSGPVSSGRSPGSLCRS